MTRTRQLATLILIAAALLFVAETAHAKQTAEEKCQKRRYDVAAKYTQCQQKLLGKLVGGSVRDYRGRFLRALSKCRVKYTGTWVKLQKKALGTGATCDRSRFEDNGDGTVTDWLTGLQWERKTDDFTVHDKDNAYSWSTSGDGDPSDPDGPAFTTFLATLNGGGCFAGKCDWRLPTIYELQTILLEPYPCTTSPCLDPVFGASTLTTDSWSSTTYADSPADAWYVDFYDGFMDYDSKTDTSCVRAVRAGL